MFTVTSDIFAHSVHFNLKEDIRFTDEYFDLLPGESRDIVLLNKPADFRLEDLKAVCVCVG